MGHKHSVRDTGAHFIIDQFTRQIKNDSANKTTIVQYDHNSETLTFEMPLNIDGHTMTLCDLIEIHYINIATDGNSENHGVYEVGDIAAGGDKAIFTWLISQDATQLAGSLNFFIVFKCTENGVTVYRWGTEICKTLAISAGMDNGEVVLTEYPDIIAQWKAQIFGASDGAVLTVDTAKETALAAIESAGEAKKQAVLGSIPDEYEALSALADYNHRNKAGAIVLDAEGESIAVHDASEYPLMGLKLFGKSTQDGTPTPDAPVDIVSVDNPIMSVYGKNLAHPVGSVRKVNGYTITPNADGTVTISGAALAAVDTVLDYALIVENNMYKATALKANVEYRLTCWKNGLVAETPGTKVVLADGTVVWGWKNVEAKDRSVAKLYTQFTPEIGDTDVCGTYAIQIEAGTQRTEYEPYKEQEVNIARTLPGIPVSGGGNYTDADGQQWICDEVDLARGVYVKRVAAERLSTVSHYNENGIYTVLPVGKSKYDTKYMCSHFADGVSYANGKTGAYASCVLPKSKLPASITSIESGQAWLDAQAAAGTPVVAVYVLSEPIETPLSEAEITAFRALHSNKPNTTILNDAGAHMAVEYVADTKTYIDNKIKEMVEGVTV